MEDLANLFNELGVNTEVKVYDYKDRKLSDIKLQSYHDIFEYMVKPEIKFLL